LSASVVAGSLAAKLPTVLPAFRLLVSRCLRVTPDPTAAGLEHCLGFADPKDLPQLAVARALRLFRDL
jgi:hypothetical protein